MPQARIYADHAATTPPRAEVVEAMLAHAHAANPSSQHAEGRAARAALDDARARVARVLGASAREIVFTGGGSEADTLAIVGAARAARSRGRHVVMSAIEHHAVLHAGETLREAGFTLTLVAADASGVVDEAAFAAALREDTVLASVMLANNEIGSVQPIARLARLARARGTLFHTDAIQAPGRLALDVRLLGVDLLSLSAHKFSGPKGVGALFVRSGTPLEPQVMGGSQEHGLRAGTENVAGIVGLACALELAEAERPAEVLRLGHVRDRFEAGLPLGETFIHAAAVERLPNVSSVAFAGVDAATFLARLDLEGVAASAGSACTSGAIERSHVLAALAVPDWTRSATVRFSFGKLTSEQDVERLVQMLPGIVRSVRDGAFLGTAMTGSATNRVEERS